MASDLATEDREELAALVDRIVRARGMAGVDALSLEEIKREGFGIEAGKVLDVLEGGIIGIQIQMLTTELDAVHSRVQTYRQQSLQLRDELLPQVIASDAEAASYFEKNSDDGRPQDIAAATGMVEKWRVAERGRREFKLQAGTQLVQCRALRRSLASIAARAEKKVDLISQLDESTDAHFRRSHADLPEVVRLEAAFELARNESRQIHTRGEILLKQLDALIGDVEGSLSAAESDGVQEDRLLFWEGYLATIPDALPERCDRFERDLDTQESSLKQFRQSLVEQELVLAEIEGAIIGAQQQRALIDACVQQARADLALRLEDPSTRSSNWRQLLRAVRGRLKELQELLVAPLARSREALDTLDETWSQRGQLARHEARLKRKEELLATQFTRWELAEIGEKFVSEPAVENLKKRHARLSLLLEELLTSMAELRSRRGQGVEAIAELEAAYEAARRNSLVTELDSLVARSCWIELEASGESGSDIRALESGLDLLDGGLERLMEELAGVEGEVAEVFRAPPEEGSEGTSVESPLVLHFGSSLLHLGPSGAERKAAGSLEELNALRLELSERDGREAPSLEGVASWQLLIGRLAAEASERSGTTAQLDQALILARDELDRIESKRAELSTLLSLVERRLERASMLNLQYRAELEGASGVLAGIKDRMLGNSDRAETALEIVQRTTEELKVAVARNGELISSVNECKSALVALERDAVTANWDRVVAELVATGASRAAKTESACDLVEYLFDGPGLAAERKRSESPVVIASVQGIRRKGYASQHRDASGKAFRVFEADFEEEGSWGPERPELRRLEAVLRAASFAKTGVCKRYHTQGADWHFWRKTREVREALVQGLRPVGIAESGEVEVYFCMPDLDEKISSVVWPQYASRELTSGDYLVLNSGGQRYLVDLNLPKQQRLARLAPAWDILSSSFGGNEGRLTVFAVNGWLGSGLPRAFANEQEKEAMSDLARSSNLICFNMEYARLKSARFAAPREFEFGESKLVVASDPAHLEREWPGEKLPLIWRVNATLDGRQFAPRR